ncbi:hypothetical protein D3C78_990130 [compost metagenome]
MQDLAGGHHGNAIGQGQGFFLIVGDENEGDPGFFLHALEFDLHFLAQLEVQGRQRFIQQQHFGFRRQGPGQSHPLLLAAGQFGRFAFGQVLHLHQREHFLDPLRDQFAIKALHLEAEGDILRNTHVRKQRVTLEHRVDPTLERRQIVDRLAREADLTVADMLEAGDGAQQGGFAAAGGAEQGEEFVVGNVHRDVIEGWCQPRIVGISL